MTREKVNDSEKTEVDGRRVHAPVWPWSLAGWTVVVILVVIFVLAGLFA